MTTPARRHIIVVLDRSGSMHRVREDTEGGLNALLDEQRQAPGITTVTLVQFDDQVETVYTGRPLDEVPEFTLQPRGMTALLDAIGTTVLQEGQRIAMLPPAETPSETTLVILTDGKDNRSIRFDAGLVRYLIDGARKNDGWTVLFLGADQDAFTVGGTLGIPSATTMGFDASQTRATLTAAGTMVRRGTQTGEFVFTDEERGAATNRPK
ncbi:vWA domain-containing protein [Streptomyces sp. NBC_01244]|uniref:vWA domain-containing protein n=1 Tax=Streptomyces sp. NBC_01244 TaxID=2903797 RepID=UPI002E0D6EA2|nr:VWA domain-containing protein [Streptomyces sp. NBC_01244]